MIQLGDFKFIDLFCGIGGFRLALDKAGGECVFSSEKNRKAAESYAANFGEIPDGDITKVDAVDIPEHDCIAAGFPCQAFSACGHRLGFRDPRGMLFFEIIRIARHHRPAVMLLENVQRIIRIDAGRVMLRILQEIDRAGYWGHVRLLNTSDYGIPQFRERVFFTCIRKDLSLRFVDPRPERNDMVVEDLMVSDDLPSHRWMPEERITWRDHGFNPEKRYHRRLWVGHFGPAPRQGTNIYATNGLSTTLTSADRYVTRPGGGVRRYDVTELKRLMGFADNHVVSDGTAGRLQLGNAVVPKMVGVLWKSIRPGFHGGRESEPGPESPLPPLVLERPLPVQRSLL